MPYIYRPFWAPLLLVILLATHILAQQTINLTLTFSPSDDTCAPRDSDNSITFTTSFLPRPGVGGCITLSDVFTSNASTGYRNTGYPVQEYGIEPLNITYTLSRQEAYDVSANYSNVLYTQSTLEGNAGEEDDEKSFAPRNVNFYAGEDCRGVVDEETVLPAYLSSCSASNDCQQFPFSVASFYLFLPREEESDDDREREGKCVLAAQYGAGSAVRPAWAWFWVVLAAMGFWELL